VERRWQDGLLTRDPDGVFTSVLGAGEVEKLIQQPSSATAALPPLPDYHYDPASPLGQLSAQLRLEPSEADLLALLLACETDPASARLVTYLGGNQSAFNLTLDLVFDIVYRQRNPIQTAAAAMQHRDLAPDGRLRRLRYVLVDGGDSRVALAQSIRLHPRLLAWLLGQRQIDAQLAAHASLVPPRTPVGECDPEQLANVVAALRSGGRTLLIEGAPQSGRQLLLEFAAAQLGAPLIVVSGRGLPPDLVVASLREASLHTAVLAFRDIDEALDKDGFHRFRECLEVFPATVAIIAAGHSGPALATLRPFTAVRVDVPEHGERLRLWRTHLGRDSGLSADELKDTAALYNLGVSGILRASASAREAASFRGERVTRAHLVDAVRQLFDADLSAVGTRMHVSQTWDDVVLPEDLQKSIHGIRDRIRYRGDVLGEWGFAQKLGKGLGLTVLFAGEPGTGKSMVAGLLAKELALDLYVIDLSRIMSKWLGETEKNLARAFDAAEAGHVLLLFDEADSLLAKRSGEVRGANDRYANLETNFILARLEQFNGIAFFTTNLSSALDPAVARRMSVQVSFPFPAAEARAELWRRMIPKDAPVQGEIDYGRLAERFKISGGFIRNIVLRAAYAAVRSGGKITMAHLEEAAQREYHERGSLGTGGRLA
jgi:AAA+ superfamily predicted ATPase